jgi:hypothetical protein
MYGRRTATLYSTYLREKSVRRRYLLRNLRALYSIKLKGVYQNCEDI